MIFKIIDPDVVFMMDLRSRERQISRQISQKSGSLSAALAY